VTAFGADVDGVLGQTLLQELGAWHDSSQQCSEVLFHMFCVVVCDSFSIRATATGSRSAFRGAAQITYSQRPV